MTMRFLFFVFLFIALACSQGLAQGTNNDFKYDEADFKFLFSKLGYEAFKFPIKQNKQQLFDIVLEEYRDGELKSRKTAIEVTKEALAKYGIDATAYAKPKMDSTQVDSVYFHRLYTERTDSSLTIHVKTHGITAPVTFDTHDLLESSVRARFETKEEVEKNGFLTIDRECLLLFFYANNKATQPLWCPAGMPKDEVIKTFPYAVFVSIVELK